MRDPRLDDPGFMLLRNGPVTRFEDPVVLAEHVVMLEAAGYKTYNFDCSEWHNAALMHEQLAERLGFPDYYGRNLDALNDCICSDLDFEGRTGIVLIMRNFDALTLTAPGDRAMRIVVLDILVDASRWHLVYGHRFLVLVQQVTEWEPLQFGRTDATLNQTEWARAFRMATERKREAQDPR